MAGLTFTTADKVLKEDYLPPVREQLNMQNALLAQVEKNSKDIEGRRANLSVHLGRTSGVGARAEGGTLPSAGNQSYGTELIPVKNVYGRIQVSGPVIAAMKSDKGSFVRAVDSEMKGLTADLKRDVNRQLWGTSDGIIASAGTTGNSTTLQLSTTITSNAQIRQLVDAVTVDLGTTADVDVVAAGLTVSGYSYANKTITVDVAVTTTVASSHKLFKAGVFAGGASNSTTELTGMQSIVAATGALFNLNPATAGQSSWQSYVDSNSGTNRSLSENLLASVIHNVAIASGEEPNIAFSSDGVHRSFANLLTSLKRFNNTVEVKGGFKGLEMTAGGGSIPFLWERDTPENQVYLLNTKNLVEFQMSDWDWMDKDGAILSRVSNTDAYEAVLFKYCELATDQRNAHGLIKDITAS
jgi:hypothetical protein